MLNGLVGVNATAGNLDLGFDFVVLVTKAFFLVELVNLLQVNLI